MKALPQCLFRGLAFLLCSALASTVHAQQSPRITQRVDENSVVRLLNTRHPLALPENDRGRVAGELPMERIQLQLNSSPEQEAALNRLLEDQQDSSSPNYHAWLTPEQFGERFGPAQEDLDAVTAWLQSHGFQGITVAAGRRSIEFNGTARQVETAFQTEMHRYVVDGEIHIANATEIAIPSALSAVVGGVVSLHDFRRQAQHHVMGRTRNPETDLVGGSHGISPYDFAAIYNVTALWNNGFDGTGQTIAIAGRTNIKLSDVATFRSTFGLPGNNTQIVLNGADPGIISPGEETEADLDVEWSGGVAKGAIVKFVVSKSTNVSDGVDLSASYIVNNNLASAMSVSFGACEAAMGSGNAFYNSLWSQAAGEGISVFVSAGDSGSAGCDAPSSSSGSSNTTTPAIHGFGVNGLASTPYNVAVGGTEFNDTASASTYWNAGNDTHYASAKGYIPEVVWNESSYTTPGAAANGLWAGSGGVSTVYARPSWQTGTGVPAFDPGTTSLKHRLLPDVSLTAAGHDAYLIYQEGGLYLVGGTSASSPSMAGIMTIVDQHSGGRNGNANTKFYALAGSTASIYHDVTTGTNAVPCEGGTPNCSTAAPSTNTGRLTGYSTGAGYDLATGWGSMDAYALALNWGAGVPAALSITSLSPSPMTASGAAQTLTINGTAFQSGASVKVGTTAFSGAAVKFVSGTQLTVSVTEAAAGAFPVTVTNPGGATSNAVSLTVSAPVVAATIASVSPNPMTTSNAAQLLTVSGTGFQPGLTLKIGGTNILSSQLAGFTATQLTVWIVTGTVAATYPVQVVNPGAAASNTVNFRVTAPPPVVSALTPNPMAVSSKAQVLTIRGTGFQSGLKVVVGSTTYSGSQVSVSATQIQVSVMAGTKATSLNVQVTNPDAQLSSIAVLQVH